MDTSDAARLRSAVEWRWQCAASLVQTVPVEAPLEGDRTWSVVVHVFDLTGCSKASRVYAWSSQVWNSSETRVFALHHVGPLNSPISAVRAAVADELRATRLAMQRNYPRASATHPAHAQLFRSPALSRAS